MSLDADAIVDRRRMRRKLTFWRVCAVVVAIAAIAAVTLVVKPRGGLEGSGYIARVKITGLIRTDQDRVEALERLGKSAVRGVVIKIDSPGGTTAGAEELYTALRELQAKKPMVVMVEGLAASGAYIAAMASDHIVAQDTSLVGSIGVLFQFPNFTGALKTLGVQVEEVKSSPLKAAPNGFEPTSPEARAALDAIVKDSYAWFKDLVKNRRKMNDDQLARVDDGRVFTGRQALELKLVDGLGTEKTAVEWLEKEKKVTPGSPVRDYPLKPRFGDLTFLHVAALALDAAGFGGLAQRLETWSAVQAMERLNLDGLLALWHPPTSN
ncbi:MAG TPA: signal peptide peptidase SppA [Pseudolabrys sp.]|nr:signal peptide peptidase SppA [Pseudolabrys sp.]